MASARALAWLDRLIWTLVYAGLLTAVVGMAMQMRADASGTSLLLGGGVAAAAGAALIWLRSTLGEPPG